MKKFLSLFAAISMVLGLVVMPVSANDPVENLEELKTAINSEAKEIVIADNVTIIIEDAKDINFSKANNKKFIGGENSVLDFSKLSGEFVSDLEKITFEKLTIKHNNSSYVGMGRSNEEYIDCIIEGMIFTWGYNAKFVRCTFNQPDSNNYNIWTYSANVDFEDCTFNCGGRSVLVWNDGSSGTKVNFEDCDFNATQEAEGKAAIEIDSSKLPENNKFEVSINDCTVSGFAKGNVSGNSLWNNKTANNGTAACKRHDVIVDGVYAIRNGEVPTYTASINNKNYETLTDAINAANPGDTVELLDNVVLTKKDSTGNANIVIDKSLTIDGNGYKVSSSTARANFRIFAEEGETTPTTVTFKDIEIENTFVGDGRCLETRTGNIVLNVVDSTLNAKATGSDQTITIGGIYENGQENVVLNVENSQVLADTHYAIVTFNPVNATINNSTLSGYAGLYFKGVVSSLGSENSKVTVNGGTIVRGEGVTGESFGLIVFEDNNITVNIKDAKIEANGVKGSAYKCFDFSYVDYLYPLDVEEDVKGNTVNLFGTKVYVSAVGATLANIKTTNKVVVYETTSNIDLTDYLAEGYVQHSKEDGTYYTHKHDLKFVEEVKVTCTENGRKAYYECTVCGEAWFDKEMKEAINAEEDLVIKSEGHKHVLDETTVKEATCTTDGYTGDKKCECGDVVKGEVVKASGHKEVVDKAVEATCTKTGLTEGKHCETCKEVLVAQKEVAALGHEYKDGKCSVCGEKDPEIKVEVEKLPVIDTTKPVEEVTVGTTKEAEEVINDTVETIIEKVEKGEEVTAVSKEVVETIKEEVKKGNDVELVTEVVVETIKEEDVKDDTVKLIVETAKGAEVVQYLDLSVLVSVVVNDEVKATSEVTELTKPMTFTIAVPEEIAEVEAGYARTYYVIREHEGKTDKLPVKVNADGTLTFTTDRFSTYALVYVDAKVETPNTGDNSFVTLFTTMTVFSLAAFLFLKRKEELN